MSVRTSLFISFAVLILLITGAFAGQRYLFGTGENARWWLFGVAVFDLGLALLAAWWLAKRFSAPLELLAARSERIGRLELEEAECVQSPFKEVQRLTDAMDAMRDALAKAIAARDAKEEALRQSESEMRYYLEATNDVIWSTDREGRFTYTNQAMERVYGYTPEEALRLTIGDLGYTAETSERDMRGLRHILAGEPLIGYEAEHVRKDGTPITVLINATAKTDSHGNVIGITGTGTDITEIKEAEKVLARSLFRESGYSQTLESEAAKRTAELERALEELRGAQDKMIVQEKLASLGSLTAGIAHEIRNPLNFVNNFAELTAELAAELRALLSKPLETLDAAARAELKALLDDIELNSKKIRKHGQQADGIVQGMLAHSRGGRAEFRPVDLNALVDENVKLAYHGMRAQDISFNVTIETDYDPGAGAVTAVPSDLGRVILNIVNNACYAVNERGKRGEEGYAPRVRVTTRNLGDEAEIRIWDNGTGMPPEVREQIFNPFFTTKPAGRGTGLGLSISFDIIVQEHKGALQVESEPGAFTEFIVTLPRTGAAAYAAGAQA